MMMLLMSGARSDVKSVVQEPSHKVLHYQCAAHRLNLTVVSSCKIQAFKECQIIYWRNTVNREYFMSKIFHAIIFRVK